MRLQALGRFTAAFSIVWIDEAAIDFSLIHHMGEGLQLLNRRASSDTMNGCTMMNLDAAEQSVL